MELRAGKLLPPLGLSERGEEGAVSKTEKEREVLEAICTL